MKYMKLTPLLVLTLLLFSGCERVVYVKVPCPKLQTADINRTTFEPLILHYEVKDDK